MKHVSTYWCIVAPTVVVLMTTFLGCTKHSPAEPNATSSAAPAAGSMVNVQLYVTQSDVVKPGDIVEITRIDQPTRTSITRSARVLSVRWRVSGPFMAPKAPAEGFVTLAVPADVAQQLKKGDFSVSLPKE